MLLLIVFGRLAERLAPLNELLDNYHFGGAAVAAQTVRYNVQSRERRKKQLGLLNGLLVDASC